MKIALVQMTSGPDIAVNLAYVDSCIRTAAAEGAQFIATPENSDFMVDGKDKKLAMAPDEANHPFLQGLSQTAKDMGVTILLGSIAVKVSANKVANRSYLIRPDGTIAARYDKIHLFDVDLPTGESRRESEMVAGGHTAVVVPTEWANFGLTICYDVRFPHLYRTLAKAGATLLAVPSAFTVPTGEMHWHVLLRARAIENGAFVIAPAQCGTHDGGRKTYGHSLVIDPWGRIIAEGGTEPALIYADIDMTEVARFRQAIPSLTHDWDFHLA